MASKRIRGRYRSAIAVGVLAVVAGGTYLALAATTSAEPTVSYETGAATLGTISVTVAGTGNVVVDGTTDVWPTTAGTVATVAIAEGSTVTTGAVLFTLEASSAEAATARALASLRQAQQSVSQARLQQTKAQNALASLVARSAEPSATVADSDIAAAEADVEVATAGVSVAAAQVTTAQLTYDQALAAEDDLTVRAPCSGAVHTLAITAGDAVEASAGGTSGGSSATDGASATASASSAPVVIAPERPLAVHLTVNEVDLPSLAVGQRADIEFDALPDITATGKVYAVADEGTNASGVVTFDVWLTIDVADERLRAGMSAAATVVTQVAKDALIVPNSAIESDGDGGYYVLVMDAGATEPRQVPVQAGLASATQTQILSGLAEGDIVVTQTIDSSDTGSSGSQPGSGMIVPGMGGGGFRG